MNYREKVNIFDITSYNFQKIHTYVHDTELSKKRRIMIALNNFGDVIANLIRETFLTVLLFCVRCLYPHGGI